MRSAQIENKFEWWYLFVCFYLDLNIRFQTPPSWNENGSKAVTLYGCQFSTVKEINISNFEYYYLVNGTHKMQPLGNLTQIDVTTYIFPPFTLSQNNQSGIYQCVLNDTERKYVSGNIESVRSSPVIFSGMYILLLFSSVLHCSIKSCPHLLLYEKYILV